LKSKKHRCNRYSEKGCNKRRGWKVQRSQKSGRKRQMQAFWRKNYPGQAWPAHAHGDRRSESARVSRFAASAPVNKPAGIRLEDLPLGKTDGPFCDSCPYCGNWKGNHEANAMTLTGYQPVRRCGRCKRDYRRADARPDWNSLATAASREPRHECPYCSNGPNSWDSRANKVRRIETQQGERDVVVCGSCGKIYRKQGDRPVELIDWLALPMSDSGQTHNHRCPQCGERVGQGGISEEATKQGRRPVITCWRSHKFRPWADEDSEEPDTDQPEEADEPPTNGLQSVREFPIKCRCWGGCDFPRTRVIITQEGPRRVAECADCHVTFASDPMSAATRDDINGFSYDGRCQQCDQKTLQPFRSGDVDWRRIVVCSSCHTLSYIG